MPICLSHALTRPQNHVASCWTLQVSCMVLTWLADVLNLKVFVGGRARVTKHVVRRHDTTGGPILAPRKT